MDANGTQMLYRERTWWLNESKMSIREGHASKSSSKESVVMVNLSTYRIQGEFDTGGCGTVLVGSHARSKQAVVIKMANNEMEQLLLATERRIYARLSKAHGWPRLIDAESQTRRAGFGMPGAITAGVIGLVRRTLRSEDGFAASAATARQAGNVP
ncbi:uncharacterized protein LOC133392114 [Anopheles gambiae]|uniref:uncharacterized protein LOC133392114 n=1 Tax=Anopheles gambiae TaxID=7165 RepID=UPI002AC9630C|nr:uncharacterized protein LOC133392114 [Anopheles gambiae]